MTKNHLILFANVSNAIICYFMLFKHEQNLEDIIYMLKRYCFINIVSFMQENYDSRNIIFCYLTVGKCTYVFTNYQGG